MQVLALVDPIEDEMARVVQCPILRIRLFYFA